MTTADVLLWLVLTPPIIVFVGRLFRFLDESAQYQVELKELRTLGLEQVDGQPVGRWLRRLHYSPGAVHRYRHIRD